MTCDSNNYETKIYKGISETAFKKRYADQKILFSIIRYKNDTKLHRLLELVSRKF